MREGRPTSGAAGRASFPPAGSGLRLVDGIAGLLAAGSLVIGIVMLLAAVVAPAALAGAGLGPAAGPGWARVIVQLAVGVVAETLVRARRGWTTPARVTADLVIICASLAAIWWVWW